MTLQIKTSGGLVSPTSEQQAVARSGLGLGSAAVASAGDFATAAQGTKADDALPAAALTGAADKTTPVDADGVLMQDSAAGGAFKWLRWSNIKAALATLYAPKGAATASGLTMATARLLGRTTAGAGAIEEIPIGNGLTMAGGTLSAASGAGVPAPSTLDGSSAVYNSVPLHLAAGGTLTVAAGALAVLPAGVVIVVGQSGTATLAFSGGATKENSSGTSATSVTLAASGVYALVPSPSGSDKWRLSPGEAAAASGAYEVANWAALLALTGVPDGRVYTVLAPVVSGGSGLPGTQWARDSTSPSGWRPAGRQVLAMLRTQVDGVSGGTTTEQMFWTPSVAAGVLAGINALVLESRLSASGADAAAKTARWRCGTTGTSADAELASFPATTNHRVYLGPQHLSYSSDTAVLPTYYRTLQSSPDSAIGNSATPQGTVTVPSMAATALYLSLSVQQGASPTATISAERAWLIVE